ncbi:MAG: methanethiol S-methyltransferase [Ginsengibacter sp.]
MKKSIILVYSLLAYLAGVVALLYVIGFVGNFVVPKSIDTGSEAGFSRALIINLVLIILFALQHSVMARPAFKAWWIRIIGTAAERSTYILLTSLALFLLCWQWQPMPMIIWKIENTHVTMILTGVYFLGWLIVFLSTFMINHFELFGLKQAFENFAGHHPGGTTFKTNFFYTVVRHPIMLGLLIAFWAAPLMTLGHLLFSFTTTVYILIAVKFLEEKDLRKSFGKEYEAYQKNVPMVIPFSGKRNNS